MFAISNCTAPSMMVRAMSFREAQESHERQDGYLERPEQPGASGYHDSFGFAVLESEWDFETDRAKPGSQW